MSPSAAASFCCKRRGKSFFPQEFLLPRQPAEAATSNAFPANDFCPGKTQSWNQLLFLLQPANRELEPTTFFVGIKRSRGFNGCTSELQPVLKNATSGSHESYNQLEKSFNWI